MTVATALVTGNDPTPQLAEDAVRQALAKTGETHANGVLLFLTPEFARHAKPAVTAAARAAQCTQVAGGIASGVFTESGWALDRPAAAVMVFARGLSLSPGFPEVTDVPVFSYAGGAFPVEWSNSGKRFGGTFAGSFAGSIAHTEPAIWQQGRLSEQQRCTVQFPGAEISIDVSTGLRLLSDPLPVEKSNGFDLEKLGGHSALQSLSQSLPSGMFGMSEMLPQLSTHLHHLAALVHENDGHTRPTALIAINADHSLTLAERVTPGQKLTWAIRQPDTAESDMRQSIERLEKISPNPACALMASCIGRGPYFYGGEDRDLNILRERFPDLPILGVYGTGQIAPASAHANNNYSLQNAVVTAFVNKLKTP